MKTKIGELTPLYKSTFPTDWIDSMHWTSYTESESSYYSGISKIKEFETATFYIVSSSILSGEYIVRKNFKQELNQIINVLTQEPPLDNAIILRNKLIKKFVNVLLFITYNLKRYLRLITSIENKHEKLQPQYILNAFKKGHILEEECSFSKYYNIMFNLVVSDHFLLYKNDSIRDLILIHASLNEEITSEAYEPRILKVLEVLDNKCLFLFKKILLPENMEFEYMIDFKVYHYNATTKKIPLFENFNTYLEFFRKEEYTEDTLIRSLQLKVKNGNIQKTH